MKTPEEAHSVAGQQLSAIDGVTFVAEAGDTLLIGVETQGKIEEVDPQVEAILGVVPFDIEYKVTGGFTMQRRERKERPLRAGANVAPDDLWSYGTLGFLMTDGSDYFVVSNNHVFALNDQLSMGHPIVQPADPFQQNSSPPFKIGELAGKVRIRDGVKGDMAWATVEVEASTEMIGIGNHEGSAITVRRGDTIKKSGATSRVTTGTVAATNATMNTMDHEGNVHRIEGCIITENHISEGGDSGSPVVKKDSQGRWRPAGIIFAGNDSLSAITPATTIENESGLEFANAFEQTLPDAASMCLPDGAGEVLYTLTVTGEIKGRDGELEPDDEISGSTVSGRIVGGHCDKFEFEGPIKSLSWEGETPNMWVNGSSVNLNSVPWANPPADDPNPPNDPSPPGDDSGGSGLLVAAALAFAFSKRG